MDEPQSVAHARWDGKSHVAWIPRYRRKTLSCHLRRHPGAVRRGLARQEECRVQAGRLLPRPRAQAALASSAIRGGPGRGLPAGEARDPHRAGLL